MEREAENTRGLQLALGMYIVVFMLKIAVYTVSGVLALLAEALHTLSDVFISAFLLGATILARREPDESHMFGHGRAQNVAALVAATLFISFTSYRLYEESIPRLFAPETAVYQNLPLVIGVIIASMFIAAVPLVSLRSQRRQVGALRAQFVELINDQLGLLAALVGTLLIIEGFPIADPIASMVVATIIAVNAVRLFVENLSFLLGKSPGAEFLALVREQACSVEGVLNVHELRAEYIGPGDVHVDMHIGVRRGITVEEAHRIGELVERRVRAAVGCRYCSVHVDPTPEDEPA
ncbi:MAG: cation diffusion facilitator family transporter [Chloroflexota bacterium]